MIPIRGLVAQVKLHGLDFLLHVSALPWAQLQSVGVDLGQKWSSQRIEKLLDVRVIVGDVLALEQEIAAEIRGFANNQIRRHQRVNDTYKFKSSSCTDYCVMIQITFKWESIYLQSG